MYAYVYTYVINAYECEQLYWVAVNFGQYDFAGYFPNRPTIAQKNMPSEYVHLSEEWKSFIDRPETTLMHTFPSQAQASKVMAILDVLSTHSPNEEYISAHMEAASNYDPEISAALGRFKGQLMEEIEGIIDSRNLDSKLKRGMELEWYHISC